MKETVKTSRAAGYLEKMFRVLNNYYFNGVIEEPIITIQSTPRAYGHVTVAKAWTRGQAGETRRELNIGAGTLDRPIENLVSTLLHEMVHLSNLQSGIKDCSRGGSYHNRRFKVAAEAVDLKISYDSRIGWSITEPTEDLIDFIVSQGWEDIQMSRNEKFTAFGIGGKGGNAAGADNGSAPKKGNSRKMVCPCCGLTVRATRDNLRLHCMDCGEQLIYV